MSLLKKISMEEPTSSPLKRLKFTDLGNSSKPPISQNIKKTGHQRLLVFKIKQFSIKKIAPLLISIALLILVIFQVQPPQVINSDSFSRLLPFFIPLIFFIFFTLNLFPLSFKNKLLISGGLTILLILKGLSWLTIPSFIGWLVILALVFKIINKHQKINYHAKTPKLSHLSKQR